MNANICLTQGCVVGIVFSDIQPKPFQKILGIFFVKHYSKLLKNLLFSSPVRKYRKSYCSHPGVGVGVSVSVSVGVGVAQNVKVFG